MSFHDYTSFLPFFIFSEGIIFQNQIFMSFQINTSFLLAN